VSLRALTGCPDDVLLALAEASALAHWKAHELRAGTLSVRELVRRADALERALRQGAAAAAAAQHRRHSYDAAAAVAATPVDARSQPGAPGQDTDARRVVAEVMREAALLYLSTILSGPFSGKSAKALFFSSLFISCIAHVLPLKKIGVPETLRSVQTITYTLQQLPQSPLDRALVLPLTLAATLTADRTQAITLRQRLAAIDVAQGNLARLGTVVDAVWARRDAGAPAVDWRLAMREQRMNLLLA
jgi:C6 transcription factor Pro1